MRLLCADTHPAHNTLWGFRRNNAALLTRAFAQVLELAANRGVLKVGALTVAINGTKILANASKHEAVSHGHAEQNLPELDLEIAEAHCQSRANRRHAPARRTDHPRRDPAPGGAQCQAGSRQGRDQSPRPARKTK